MIIGWLVGSNNINHHNRPSIRHAEPCAVAAVLRQVGQRGAIEDLRGTVSQRTGCSGGQKCLSDG